MADEKLIRMDDTHYVNEATLELLQRRIESEVKTNFLRWVGVPTGSGILLGLLALYIYIPNVISSFMQKDPVVQRHLEEAAVEYLKDPERGQRFLRERLRR